VSNMQLARDVYEAFGRGDIKTVLGMMDPDIEWSEAEGNPYKPDGKPWLGPDAILNNLFRKIGTDWASFTITPREFHDAGSVVAVDVRYTGVYKETGKSLNAQVCHVLRWRDGKLAGFQQYVDTAQLQEVMGLH